MGPSFKDSGRYASLHAEPNGPGDARPTCLQILQDNEVVGKMTDKVAFVTGGSNGIGVDEVKALALTGAIVVFTSRDLAKGQKVKQDIIQQLEGQAVTPRIEIVKMDLQSLDSVREGVEEFKKNHDQLNILVNNAGIGNTPHGLTKDGYEQQFGVNHLAHFCLFQLLKPMLLSSSTSSFNSRVIDVSSSIHVMGSVKVGDYNLEQCGYDPFLAYASSKTCNIWMANEIDRKYGNQGLHAISVHPGGIYTGLLATHDKESKKIIDGYLEMEHIKRAIKSIDQGAASVVLAAVGKEYEGTGGYYMEDCGISPPFPKDAPLGTPGYMPWIYDPEGERQLWIDSLKMVKMDEE